MKTLLSASLGTTQPTSTATTAAASAAAATTDRIAAAVTLIAADEAEETTSDGKKTRKSLSPRHSLNIGQNDDEEMVEAELEDAEGLEDTNAENKQGTATTQGSEKVSSSLSV